MWKHGVAVFGAPGATPTVPLQVQCFAPAHGITPAGTDEAKDNKSPVNQETHGEDTRDVDEEDDEETESGEEEEEDVEDAYRRTCWGTTPLTSNTWGDGSICGGTEKVMPAKPLPSPPMGTSVNPGGTNHASWIPK